MTNNGTFKAFKAYFKRKLIICKANILNLQYSFIAKLYFCKICISKMVLVIKMQVKIVKIFW